MFKRLDKRGEEDIGKPFPTIIEILVILSIFVAVAYMLWSIQNGFSSK